jgi:hypothetical protein
VYLVVPNVYQKRCIQAHRTCIKNVWTWTHRTSKRTLFWCSKMILKTLLLFFIGLLVLTISLGLFFHPKFVPIHINPNTSPINPLCATTPTTCENDSDCTKCLDNTVMRCTSTSTSSVQKFCLPSKPEKPCNEKLGGVWTWTGWGREGNHTSAEWECMCTYPEIAGNIGCTRLNPNVCRGGVFSFDASGGRGPSPNDCVCGPNTFKIITPSNVPQCVPKNEWYCHDLESCKNFYGGI